MKRIKSKAEQREKANAVGLVVFIVLFWAVVLFLTREQSEVEFTPREPILAVKKDPGPLSDALSPNFPVDQNN